MVFIMWGHAEVSKFFVDNQLLKDIYIHMVKLFTDVLVSEVYRKIVVLFIQ